MDDLESAVPSSPPYAAQRIPEADTEVLVATAYAANTTRSRRRLRIATYLGVGAAVIIVVALAAAVVSLRDRIPTGTPSGASFGPQSTTEKSVVVSLPSSGKPAGGLSQIASPFSAIIRADRGRDGGCVWFEASDGTQITALWPVNYKAEFKSTTQTVVLDEKGTVVATSGQRYYTSVIPWLLGPPERCVVSTSHIIAVNR